MRLRAKTVTVLGANFAHNYVAEEREFLTLRYLPDSALAVVRHRLRPGSNLFAIVDNDEIKTTIYAPGEWLHATEDA